MKFTLAILAATASAVAVESNDQFGWDCYGDWIWEDCSGYYYQSDYCTDDCGWWYSAGFDDDWSDDFWVSCEEFDSWEECQVIDIGECTYSDWIWEECSQMHYQVDYCRDDIGWWYSTGDLDN